MSPHWLFAAIMTLSISAAIWQAVASNEIDELADMAVILVLASTGVGIALLVTRSYWKNAMRIA